MKNIPTREQVYSSKNWTNLFASLNIAKRNSREHKKVQDYVISTYPDGPLQKREYGATICADRLRKIVQASLSYTECILNAGWKPGGGSYTKLYKYIETYGISTSHFVNKSRNKGKIPHNISCTPIEEYLVNPSRSISSHKLKLRLIREGIKKH